MDVMMYSMRNHNFAQTIFASPLCVVSMHSRKIRVLLPRLSACTVRFLPPKATPAQQPTKHLPSQPPSSPHCEGPGLGRHKQASTKKHTNTKQSRNQASKLQASKQPNSQTNQTTSRSFHGPEASEGTRRDTFWGKRRQIYEKANGL